MMVGADLRVRPFRQTPPGGHTGPPLLNSLFAAARDRC